MEVLERKGMRLFLVSQSLKDFQVANCYLERGMWQQYLQRITVKKAASIELEPRPWEK